MVYLLITYWADRSRKMCVKAFFPFRTNVLNRHKKMLIHAGSSLPSSFRTCPTPNANSSPTPTFHLLLNIDLQPDARLEELPSLLRNIARVQILKFRRYSALDRNQTSMHAAVGKSAVEALHHVPLRGFDEREGEQLRDGVPGEMAVRYEEGGLGCRGGFGEGLETRDGPLGDYVEGEVCRLNGELVRYTWDGMEGRRDSTLKSSSISSTETSNTPLGLIRAALNNTTSSSSPCVSSSICFNAAGMAERSDKSRATVSTLTLGPALATKGASSFWRRWVLRARRITWLKPLEAKMEEMWLPIPGPEPNTMMVRVGDIVVVWGGMVCR